MSLSKELTLSIEKIVKHSVLISLNDWIPIIKGCKNKKDIENLCLKEFDNLLNRDNKESINKESIHKEPIHKNKYKMDNNTIDIMNIIEEDDKELLKNKRICNMDRIDWGKTIAVSNQYIQRNILRELLEKYGYKVYATDDEITSKLIDTKNNSPGFDIIIITPSNKILRIQSKLRQVNGKYDYSMQIHFETTRRNSDKNKEKNHTGHVCYSLDEFDYVMVSLVNDKLNRDNIKNCNLWSYSFIPIKELEDKEHNCCISKIPPQILKSNIIDVINNEDIRSKLI
jgi:hypothetical protein